MTDFGMTYIGVFNDLPKTANLGDIAMISESPDTSYIYTGEWVKLGLCESTNTDTAGEIIETNCPNCGAPIDKSLDKCPYCSTPYIRR